MARAFPQIREEPEKITARGAFVSRIRIADIERMRRRSDPPFLCAPAEGGSRAWRAESGRPRKSLLKGRFAGAPRLWACTHWSKLDFSLLFLVSFLVSWRLGGEFFLFGYGFAALSLFDIQRFAPLFSLSTSVEGITYNSVRHIGGECIAAFRPSSFSQCVPGRNVELWWNGTALRGPNGLYITPA